ncbi:hypothetical protein D3C81_2121590 [compost metagenome]
MDQLQEAGYTKQDNIHLLMVHEFMEDNEPQLLRLVNLHTIIGKQNCWPEPSMQCRVGQN